MCSVTAHYILFFFSLSIPQQALREATTTLTPTTIFVFLFPEELWTVLNVLDSSGLSEGKKAFNSFLCGVIEGFSTGRGIANYPSWVIDWQGHCELPAGRTSTWTHLWGRNVSQPDSLSPISRGRVIKGANSCLVLATAAPRTVQLKQMSKLTFQA